jgi:hypothetical protein
LAKAPPSSTAKDLTQECVKVTVVLRSETLDLLEEFLLSIRRRYRRIRFTRQGVIDAAVFRMLEDHTAELEEVLLAEKEDDPSL